MNSQENKTTTTKNKKQKTKTPKQNKTKNQLLGGRTVTERVLAGQALEAVAGVTVGVRLPPGGKSYVMQGCGPALGQRALSGCLAFFLGFRTSGI
jgi:hypothetical protein